MPEEPIEALRLALNEMEERRRRSLWITRFMLVCMIGCWIFTYVMILLRGNLGMGIIFGLDTVMCGIFAAMLGRGASSLEYTQTILRAIEKLASDRRIPPY